METKLNNEGAEINDPKPISVPTGIQRPLTLQEQIKRLMRVELSRASVDNGYESWEEANDFNVGDGDEPLETQYTMKDEIPFSLTNPPEGRAAQPLPAEGGTGAEGDPQGMKVDEAT